MMSSNIKGYPGGEGGHMVDLDVSKLRSHGHQHREGAKAFVEDSIDVFENEIMNAIALAGGGGPTGVGERIGNIHSTRHMSNDTVTQCYIRDPAERADIGCLVPGGKDNGKAALSNPAPIVIQNIAPQKNALCLLTL